MSREVISGQTTLSIHDLPEEVKAALDEMEKAAWILSYSGVTTAHLETGVWSLTDGSDSEEIRSLRGGISELQQELQLFALGGLSVMFFKGLWWQLVSDGWFQADPRTQVDYQRRYDEGQMARLVPCAEGGA